MFLDLFKIKTASDAKVSLFKTISWRLVGTLDTIFISYLFTGKLELALGIGAFEVVSKMLLYYLHERAWVSYLKRKV